MPTRLLLAYDGSETAAAAIGAAAALFPGARADVAHVRPAPLVTDHTRLARVALPDAVITASAREHERIADETARAVAERGRALAAAAGLDATASIHIGASPWRVLGEAAEAAGADVVVCGTRGLGGFSRAVLGSTSSTLLRHASRPVLVVPPGAGDLHGPLLVGYDGSDGARAAIAAAARLLPGHAALVVHAWSSPVQRSFAGGALLAVPIPEFSDATRELDEVFAGQAQDTADEGAELARAAGLDARAVAVESAPGAWRALAATARAEGAALIVAGSRGRGALASTVLGSVSEGLVHNADLPVLIVREGERASAGER